MCSTVVGCSLLYSVSAEFSLFVSPAKFPQVFFIPPSDLSILSISSEAKLLLSNVLSFSKGAYISELTRGDFSSLFTLSATKLSCLNTGFSSFFHSPCLLFSKGSGIGMSGMM